MMFTYCVILQMVIAIQTLSSSAKLQVISKLSMTASKIGNLMHVRICMYIQKSPGHPIRMNHSEPNNIEFYESV